MYNRDGKPAAFFKADWDMAYKHASVRKGDHHLKVLEFCGHYFVEKCLTFGRGNSPTLPFTCEPFKDYVGSGLEYGSQIECDAAG